MGNFKEKEMPVRDVINVTGKLYMYMPDDPCEKKPRIIRNHNLTKLTMLRGDCSAICGKYTHNIYGDCSNICGNISNLLGDVSGLSGDVTRLSGVCTGIKCNCDLLERGNIVSSYKKWVAQQELIKYPLFCSKTRFLTEEDNERLWEVWLKLANSTIGLTDSEYSSIRNPMKNKPPFPVDKWGRCYIREEDSVVVFSINPVDIFLLRTNQEQQTCWSIYDKTNGNLRMRLLLALNSINPTVGVCFRIKYIDKFNIFTKLPFKYYKHKDGTFFQYNEKGVRGFGDIRIDLAKYYPDTGEFIEPKIYGHDGNNCGHGRQSSLIFYEKYIKEDFSLVRAQKPEGCEHVLANFDGWVFLDKNLDIIDSKYLCDSDVKKWVDCLRRKIEVGCFDEKV